MENGGNSSSSLRIPLAKCEYGFQQRAYKKYFARTRKGAVSRAEFEIWAREAEALRDAELKEYERARTEAEKKEIADALAKRVNQA